MKKDFDMDTKQAEGKKRKRGRPRIENTLIFYRGQGGQLTGSPTDLGHRDDYRGAGHADEAGAPDISRRNESCRRRGGSGRLFRDHLHDDSGRMQRASLKRHDFFHFFFER